LTLRITGLISVTAVWIAEKRMDDHLTTIIGHACGIRAENHRQSIS
jgi:hypothetical protein